jgi:hypothetical protein
VAITTTLTHLVGKPLARLHYNQQMYDANFRYSLVRVRECSEQIALLKARTWSTPASWDFWRLRLKHLPHDGAEHEVRHSLHRPFIRDP